jgi:cellulose synthase/poly-beta-1,6-N-acetylglucosamine synthase-like glycosyltransferase
MLSIAMVAMVCLPSLLTLVWFFEVAAGCVALSNEKIRTSSLAPGAFFHKTAVLIPAHNEGSGILPTIRGAAAQLGPHDHILVVADNCTDDTAALAEAAGVEVIVRTEPERRGKGYALEFGVRHLGINPPDIVVIVDADCRLGENALKYLSNLAKISGRPVQSLYHMLAPQTDAPGKAVPIFAWRVKNWIRPLGLRVFGLPTQLFGTGMAFPFSLLVNRDLGNSRLAEDTALGLALASEGFSPLFLSEATIYSHFPALQGAGEQQRQRWEKGHFDNIVDFVPGALFRSLRKRDLNLASLAVDMAVPPLSVLVLLMALCDIVGSVAMMFGAPRATFGIPLLSTLLLVIGILLAWKAAGRDLLPPGDLIRLPLHAFEKLGFYRRLASGKRASAWVRTDRDK